MKNNMALHLSNDDERYTPSILVQPLLKHLKYWEKLRHSARKVVILCPFDLETSEFVIFFSENGYEVKWAYKYRSGLLHL